jgi:predicted transcriptional regulator
MCKAGLFIPKTAFAWRFEMNKDQLVAVQRVALAVLESIDEAGPLGAPSGILYAALMAQGCTLDTYRKIMDPLVRKGFLVLEHDCYSMTAAGRQFMKTLKEKTAQLSRAAC